MIKKQIKLIKLLILIRYLYEIKKAAQLLALGFEAGEDEIRTYDPALKYSSKQREGWSDIDYFGARYYDNATFRFTSPDPVRINKERTYKPWLLNLYAYTRNNPMSFVDLDGRVDKKKTYQMGTDEYANELAKQITQRVEPMIQIEKTFSKYLGIAKDTGKGTFKMVTSPRFVRCMTGCMILPTAQQTAGSGLELYRYNMANKYLEQKKINRTMFDINKKALSLESKVFLVTYLFYCDYCTYKCVKEYSK